MAFAGLLMEGLTKGRIEALTDGIYATVITILVLGLRVPELNVQESSLTATTGVIGAVLGAGVTLLLRRQKPALGHESSGEFKFCHKCGVRNSRIFEFCPSCGTKQPQL